MNEAKKRKEMKKGRKNEKMRRKKEGEKKGKKVWLFLILFKLKIEHLKDNSAKLTVFLVLFFLFF